MVRATNLKNHKVPSKGVRLNWKPLKGIKPMALNPTMIKGEVVKVSASTLKSYLVP